MATLSAIWRPSSRSSTGMPPSGIFFRESGWRIDPLENVDFLERDADALLGEEDAHAARIGRKFEIVNFHSILQASIFSASGDRVVILNPSRAKRSRAQRTAWLVPRG